MSREAPNSPGGLQNIQVNIAVVAVIAILVIGGVAYALFVAPAMREADIKKNWVSPEAAAKRGPGKQVSPEFEQAVMRAREKNSGGAGTAPAPVAPQANMPPPVGMPPPPVGMAPPPVGMQPGGMAGGNMAPAGAAPGGGQSSFSAHRRRDD